MKKFNLLFVILIVLVSFKIAQSQNSDMRGYVLSGKNHQAIPVNQALTKTTEITPFGSQVSPIFGLAVKAKVSLFSEKSEVRIILTDKQGNEYLVYEAYPLIEEASTFSVDNLCEETAILNSVQPQSLRFELSDAQITVKSITYSTGIDQGVDVRKEGKDKKNLRNSQKLQQINKSIKDKGLTWMAGSTCASELIYSEKKKLFGQKNSFPAGIEFYVGGIIQTGNGSTLKPATKSAMVENWDWRNRQGNNWLTDVKDQGLSGSCWAFAAIGATEAQVNLFYNQQLNMNLSEQNLLSCSGAGTTEGGYPGLALDFITNSGIVDEQAFPYMANNQSCSNKSSNPADLIKIGGKVDFGSDKYPVSEDNLKRMLIKYGPMSGGLENWGHAMTLVGWQTVKAGDSFSGFNNKNRKLTYTVPANSKLIDKTVWIFKNSWGAWGDGGYVYVATDITNFAWTHALLAPIKSMVQNYTVQCVDNDNDGYYWWGLGSKPAYCPTCPDSPDGNDADANLGPLDNNGNYIPLNSAPKLKNAKIEKSVIGSTVSLTIFPNPAEQTLNLKVDEFSYQDVYSIYNLQGVLISQEPLNSNVTRVDVSGLPTGMYIVTVNNGNQLLKEKFTKK